MTTPLTLSFTVPGAPQPKQRPRVVRVNGGRPIAFTPPETRRYERAVRGHAALVKPRGWPLDARYRLAVRAVFGNARRHDGDNVLKCIGDAGNGVLWKDDSQIGKWEIETVVERGKPRTEVRVEVIS